MMKKKSDECILFHLLQLDGKNVNLSGVAVSFSQGWAALFLRKEMFEFEKLPIVPESMSK